MLRIEIFDKPESEKTPTLMLNTQVRHGIYQVFACDEAGKPLTCGFLWSLYPSGRQEDHPDINPKLGLDLGDGGHIRHV